MAFSMYFPILYQHRLLAAPRMQRMPCEAHAADFATLLLPEGCNSPWFFLAKLEIKEGNQYIFVLNHIQIMTYT